MLKKIQGYEEKVKFLKNIQILLVILCIAAVAVYFFILTRPHITTYEVKDECGSIGGTISHSIDDEDSCSNACNAFCQSKQKTFQNSRFYLALKEGCNSCSCDCRDK